MAILIDEHKKVIVQGITGREGQARTRLMLDYGTKVVGGVTPGKGGSEVFGLPVFTSCAEAAKPLGRIDISVLFVPAAGVKDAALDRDLPRRPPLRRIAAQEPGHINLQLVRLPGGVAEYAALEFGLDLADPRCQGMRREPAPHGFGIRERAVREIANDRRRDAEQARQLLHGEAPGRKEFCILGADTDLFPLQALIQ